MTAPTPNRRPPAPIGQAPTPPATERKPLDLTPRKPVRKADIVLLYAVEGYGKTSIGAHALDPVIIMAEHGYETLLGRGLVPAVPAIAVDSWQGTLDVLDQLAQDKHDRKTVVIDSTSAVERMAVEHVVATEFNGDRGNKGFQDYGRGYGSLANHWVKFLQRLTRLRDLGMDVLILAHAKAESFKNPEGADFRRYVPAMYHGESASVREPTKQIADALLFGNFESIVELTARDASRNIAEQKGKGVGLAQRIVHAQRRDAADAKNRHGIPPSYYLSDTPEQAAAEFWSYFKGVQQ
jgi:hypothetical protein